MSAESAQRQKTLVIVTVLAVVVIAAAVAFYQRSKTSDSTVTSTPSQSSNINSSTSTQSNSTNDATAEYADGTYEATGNYRSPGGAESVDVSLTIVDGVITESTVMPSGNNRESKEYQSQFVSNYKQYVVGKELADLTLSRVSGSSLTPLGFNQAVDAIRSQAQS